MGGVVGTLAYFYCRSGCQASVVASYLAFHPPESTYDFQLKYTSTEEDHQNSKSNSVRAAQSNFDELTIVLHDPRAGWGPSSPLYDRVSAHYVKTSNKTHVPVVYIRSSNSGTVMNANKGSENTSNTATQTRKYTILFSHGNATDLGGMLNVYLDICESLGVNVAAYDYSGYGVSAPAGLQPTEKQTYRDIDAVYRWLVDSGCVTDPAREIVLYGQSVGSGPSVYLATRYRDKVAGLVLHSGITSGIRVLTPSRLLCCFDIFPNIDRIRRVRVPVLVIHGQDDREVRVQHGIDLYNAVPPALRHEPWWVPHRGHNNVLHRNESEYCRRMAAFLDSLPPVISVRSTDPVCAESSGHCLAGISAPFTRYFSLGRGSQRVGSTFDKIKSKTRSSRYTVAEDRDGPNTDRDLPSARLSAVV